MILVNHQLVCLLVNVNFHVVPVRQDTVNGAYSLWRKRNLVFQLISPVLYCRFSRRMLFHPWQLQCSCNAHPVGRKEEKRLPLEKEWRRMMVTIQRLRVQSPSCCHYTNPLYRAFFLLSPATGRPVCSAFLWSLFVAPRRKEGHSRSLRGFLSEDRPVETYLYTANYNKEYSFCQDIIERYAIVITVCLLKRYLTAKRASHGDGG